MGLAVTPILKTQTLRPMFSRKQIVWSRQCDKILPLVAFAAWPLGRHRFKRFMRFTKLHSKESAENDLAKLSNSRRSSLGNRRDMKGWPMLWFFEYPRCLNYICESMWKQKNKMVFPLLHLVAIAMVCCAEIVLGGDAAAACGEWSLWHGWLRLM